MSILRLWEEQARFMRHLEKRGLLHRAIEFLPTDEEIAQRKARGLGLTTPEAAVLLAYGKMWLNDELIASDDVFFCATGITTGLMVEGVERTRTHYKVQTMMVTGATGERQIITSHFPE